MDIFKALLESRDTSFEDKVLDESEQSLDEANYRLKLWEYHYNHKRKHPARVGERRSGSSDADFQQLGF